MATAIASHRRHFMAARFPEIDPGTPDRPRAGGWSMPSARLATGRLLRPRQLRHVPYRHADRSTRLDRQPLPLVLQLDRVAGEQLVGRAVGGDLDPQPAAPPGQREPEPAQRACQVRGEAQYLTVVTHAAQPG